MSRLKGKVAIITGGAGGIGAATARRFCEEHAAVLLVDLPTSPLDDVVVAVRDRVPGARVVGLAADLAGEPAATFVVEQALKHFGQIDVLVNNAGIRAYEPLAQARAETWQRILSVNLLSYAFLTREALPALRASGRGAVVNISSTHAFHARAGMAQYDVAKAGIISMTRSLAFEESAHGVRANAVCPGLTLTPFHVKRAAAEGKTEQDLRTAVVGNNLQKRWADPREIANPILWLASDEASFVNGAALMVDGGTVDS
jgi:NAD(P)-dependent dehydrogenase (short-subunit alcohol dehydrogenase family)